MSLKQEYLCSECRKPFKEQKDLERYCKSTGHKYNIEKKIKCPDFNKEYKSTEALKQHQRDKHPKIKVQSDLASTKKEMEAPNLK